MNKLSIAFISGIIFSNGAEFFRIGLPATGLIFVIIGIALYTYIYLKDGGD